VQINLPVYASLPNGIDGGDASLHQWLSTFFVLVHPLKLVRKPVHPCHCTKI